MPERDRTHARSANPRRHRLLALAGFSMVLAWRALRGRPLYMSAVRAGVAPSPAKRDRHRNPATAYEPSDWDIGPVALIYAGLLALLVICCFVLIAAYPTALPDADRSLRGAPPGPRLQTNSGADLEQFRAEEQKRLDTYYWIDKQKAVVHIPIREAMKNLVQSGIPGFPKAAQ